MKDHMIGTTFRYVIADCNALWKVVARRGKDVYVCEVVDEKIKIDDKEYSSDHAGYCQVFAAEQIRQLQAAEKALQAHWDRSDQFYASLKPGQIVHYCNGGSKWVRLRAEKRNGRMVVIPIALVGEWRKYDLPYRNRTGEEVVPYHPAFIRDSKPFDTPASNIYECKDHPRYNAINPAGLPAISLKIPPIDEAEAVRIVLWKKLQQVEEVLQQHSEQDPQNLLDEIVKIVTGKLS